MSYEAEDEITLYFRGSKNLDLGIHTAGVQNVEKPDDVNGNAARTLKPKKDDWGRALCPRCALEDCVKVKYDFKREDQKRGCPIDVARDEGWTVTAALYNADRLELIPMEFDLLLYIHLFRTGGSSLAKMLQNALGPKFARAPLEYITNNPKEIMANGVLLGHIPFGVHQFLPFRRCAYATMLRHPADRRISSFFSDPEGNATKREFIERYRAGRYPGHENIQTKLIAGGIPMLLAQGYFPVAEQESSEELLEKAKTNLKGFAFVGDFARYEYNVRRMQALFGWPELTFEHENRSTNRPKTIPDDIVDIICKVDWMDCELYQWAQENLW